MKTQHKTQVASPVNVIISVVIAFLLLHGSSFMGIRKARCVFIHAHGCWVFLLPFCSADRWKLCLGDACCLSKATPIPPLFRPSPLSLQETPFLPPASSEREWGRKEERERHLFDESCIISCPMWHTTALLWYFIHALLAAGQRLWMAEGFRSRNGTKMSHKCAPLCSKRDAFQRH